MPSQVSRFEREFEVTRQGLAGAPEWLALVAAPTSQDALPRRFVLFEPLRGVTAEAQQRGVALATRRGADLAQVARISWRVASGTGQ